MRENKILRKNVLLSFTLITKRTIFKALGVSLPCLFLLSCAEKKSDLPAQLPVQSSEELVRRELSEAGWRNPAIERLMDANLSDFNREYNIQPSFHAFDFKQYLRLGADKHTQQVIEAAPECAEVFILDDDGNNLAKDILRASGSNKLKIWTLCSYFGEYIDPHGINVLERAFERQPDLFNEALNAQSDLRVWLPFIIQISTYSGNGAFDHEYDAFVRRIILQPMTDIRRAAIFEMLELQGEYLRHLFATDREFRSSAQARWEFLFSRFQGIKEPIFDKNIQNVEPELIPITGQSLPKPPEADPDAFYSFFAHPDIWKLAAHPRRYDIFENERIDGSIGQKPTLFNILELVFGNEAYLAVTLTNSPSNRPANFTVVTALEPIARERAINFLLLHDPVMHMALSEFRNNSSFLNYISREDFDDPLMVRCIPVQAFQKYTLRGSELDFSNSIYHLNKFAAQPSDTLRALCVEQDSSWREYVPGYSVKEIFRKKSLGIEPHWVDWVGGIGDGLALAAAIPTGGASLGLKSLASGVLRKTAESGMKAGARKVTARQTVQLTARQSFRNNVKRRLAAQSQLRRGAGKKMLTLQDDVARSSSRIVARGNSGNFMKLAGIRSMRDANGARWLVDYGDRVAYELVEDFSYNVGFDRILTSSLGKDVIEQAVEATGQTQNLFRRLRLMSQYGVQPRHIESVTDVGENK